VLGWLSGDDAVSAGFLALIQCLVGAVDAILQRFIRVAPGYAEGQGNLDFPAFMNGRVFRDTFSQLFNGLRCTGRGGTRVSSLF